MSRKKIVYILFLVIFVTTLFFMNNIILSNVSNKLKIDSPENYPENKKVYAAIDSSYKEDIFLERELFSGWTFCETLEDNKNKKMKFIFSSDDNTYSVEFSKGTGRENEEYKLLPRQDVKNAYHDLDVYNDNNGFRLSFSTVKMKDGEYKLYIYCEENEIDYGIVDTGRIYMKKGKTFAQKQ